MHFQIILSILFFTMIAAQKTRSHRKNATTVATTGVQSFQAQIIIHATTPPVAVNSEKKVAVRGPGVAPLQSENPWDALDHMRGRGLLSAEEIQTLMENAVPGVDFPLMSAVPDQTKIQCQNMKQPGFYADVDYKCQVFRRCDPNGNIFGFLCPNTTLFNQITLTCDYYFNVDCTKAENYYDYSNSRLYHEHWLLLGNNEN